MAMAACGEVDSALRLLEAWIESRMAYRQQPGLSAGIVHDQELVWSKGFGWRDPENRSPATPQTLYRIASITKLFTATAVLQLRDEGRLQLDDPVAQHLSWFKIKSRFEDAPAVTIRHLLTHTSGLPREAAFPYWTDFEFPTREQMIEALPGQEAAFPPDTQWKYSNLALALACYIVAAFSVEAYEAYIHRHILYPLGMKYTNRTLCVFPRSRSGAGTRYPVVLSDGFTCSDAQAELELPAQPRAQLLLLANSPSQLITTNRKKTADKNLLISRFCNLPDLRLPLKTIPIPLSSFIRAHP